MGRLTTHVLDTGRGVPASGLLITLERLTESGAVELGRYTTNDDGRVSAPLLEGETMTVGDYVLTFQAGTYFASLGVAMPAGPFLDVIPIRFHIADAAAHYHVPLLLSPYGYSTYRGS